MNIAGDEFGERTHAGPRHRVLGQKRRFGMGFVKIFDDRKRLDQNVAARGDQDRHAHLRIDRAKLRPFVMSAVLDQVD